MDHPLIHSGILFPKNRNIFNSTALYDLRQVKEISADFVNYSSVMGHLTLTKQVMQREGLLNISALLYPRPVEFASPAKTSMKTLMSSVRRRELPKDILQHLGNVVTNIDSLAAYWYKYGFKQQSPSSLPNLSQGGWSKQNNLEQRYGMFEVFSQTEQAPNPDNRVTLSTKLDKLGCPQTQLTWKWTETDISSIKRSQAILAEDIARSGLGTLQVPLDGELPQVIFPGTHHHIGTTRMHNDPKQGVVDANCQVHGVSNLFIAGSSVFPTGGYANPTLTIVALSIRLADHIKTSFATKLEMSTASLSRNY
jgi:choline dehydrogenase-like flavoprotein